MRGHDIWCKFLVGIVHEQINHIYKNTMSAVNVRIMVVSKRDTSFTIKVNPSSDLCFIYCLSGGDRMDGILCL